MSSLVNPVGPQEPGVYWRRRLLLLLAVLAVLGLIWFLFFRGSGSSGAAPVASPTATPTVAPTKPTATPTKASPSSTATAVGPCKGSDIGVAVATDKKSYPVGTPVKLTLTITNEGGSSCTRDIGAKANTIKVTSGGYAVWSSDDCNPGGASNIVTMKPGDVYEVKLSWEGGVTDGSCPANPPAAKAGAYDAQGINGDVRSSLSRFDLV